MVAPGYRPARATLPAYQCALMRLCCFFCHAWRTGIESQHNHQISDIAVPILRFLIPLSCTSLEKKKNKTRKKKRKLVSPAIFRVACEAVYRNHCNIQDMLNEVVFLFKCSVYFNCYMRAHDAKSMVIEELRRIINVVSSRLVLCTWVMAFPKHQV
jgi:hypothetical protein